MCACVNDPLHESSIVLGGAAGRVWLELTDVAARSVTWFVDADTFLLGEQGE